MVRSTLALSALALFSVNSNAQELRPDRPALPAMSLEEDGALSIWRNPANNGFDPDPSFALLYGGPIEDAEVPTAPKSFAMASNAGPLGFGVSHLSQATHPNWWTVSGSLAIPLGRNIFTGAHVGLQLPPGPNNNFTTVDVGLGWRPLPWWGFSTVGYNIGVDARHIGIEEQVAAGTTFRFGEGFMELGAAYRLNTSADSVVPGYLEGTLNMELTRGLTVRMSGNQFGTVGVGMEIGFGGSRVGAHGTTQLGGSAAPYVMGSLIDDPDTGKLFNAKSKVPEFVLNERYPYQPVRSFFLEQGESYLHLLGRLHTAANAKDTKAILIEIDHNPFSMAQSEEVLSVLDQARANGKKVVIYLDEGADNSAYLLAAGADLVLMNPAQQLMLVGLSAELTFFRETLDMIGVRPQFTRRSEYKSAAEGMTDTQASAAQREQINALLDDLSGRLVARVAQGRNMTPQAVVDLIDQGPFTSQEAQSHGLVDDVAYPDQVHKKVKKYLGKMAFFDKNYQQNDPHTGWLSAAEIAVIFVEGVITSGPSQQPGMLGGSRTAGSETIVKQLRKASSEDSVKAVVLRVDSPGGSALASDEIWRAVQEVKRAGKPVVVSMGGVAASGGYYVSAGADAIFAQRSTITGSIGVIAGKFSFDELYEKLGINYETYIRGRNAAMFSSAKPFDDVEFAAFDRMVGDIYGQFTSKVAHGRSLELKQVEEVARGRVWSGERAKENRLVDEFGGFYEAVAYAREAANISGEAELVTFREELGPRDELSRAGVRLLQRSVLGPSSKGNSIPELELIRQIQAMGDERVWALMPYRLDVR
jgi:protease-4